MLALMPHLHTTTTYTNWTYWCLHHSEKSGSQHVKWENTAAQCTTVQAVSVLRWRIVYPYLPVTILHNFSIQSKVKWYPKGILAEPLRIWTIKAILSRMSSTKEMQHFAQLFKIPVFACWHSISVLDKDHVMNSARCARWHYFPRSHCVC